MILVIISSGLPKRKRKTEQDFSSEIKLRGLHILSAILYFNSSSKTWLVLASVQIGQQGKVCTPSTGRSNHTLNI